LSPPSQTKPPEPRYFTEFNALFNTSLIGIVTDIKVRDLNIDKMYANIDC